MDAYYASVEQRDNPEFKGKPVAVGGSRGRGVVAAASYEARTFGIHSAMPSRTAFRLCPQIIFVPPRFDVYKAVSSQIMNIFRQYTDLVEPLSLDEAFLDVTENSFENPSATLVAQEIKQKIQTETKLTASAGVSVNKFLAKVASDIDKPDGLTVIPPDQVLTFIAQLPIEKFYGVGKVTAEKMKKLGIICGADLKKWDEVDLVHQFGKVGHFYYQIARGNDNREVKPHRVIKSIGAERTFDEDIADLDTMTLKLRKILEDVHRRLVKKEKSGRTVTVKIKYHDFIVNTRSRTLDYPIQTHDQIWPVVQELFHTPNTPDRPVRLLGVSLSNLSDNNVNTDQGQLGLDL